MKAQHIITTCGIIIGGILAAESASAVVTYRKDSNVQFTFDASLSLTLDSNAFTITDLLPGNSKLSNQVTATVSTNSIYGYTLSATVGDGSAYDTTDLVMDTNNKFEMTAGGASLSSGTWGYTLDNGVSYGALDTTTQTILNKTTNEGGTAATGYTGGSTTEVKIGAAATSTQRSGDYQNVINFAVVANVANP